MGGIPVPLALTVATLVLATAAAMVFPPHLTVSVVTDSDRWPPGTPIPLTVRVTNTGRETLRLEFSNTCRAAVRVFDPVGVLVVVLGQVCGDMITAATLAPGESIEVRYVWDQRNADGDPVRGGMPYEARPTLYLLGPRPELSIRYVPAVIRIA